MKTQKTILLVINPIAGGTDKKPIIERFKTFVSEKDYAAEVYETTGEDDQKAIDELVDRINPERVFISGGDGTIREVADVLNEKVMVSGWQESSNLDLMEYLEYYLQLGIEYVICTDISKDGVLQGPSFDLYQKILGEFPELKLIASGGVSGKDDLIQLKDQGLYGAIVGKAFYEGHITLEELASI